MYDEQGVDPVLALLVGIANDKKISDEDTHITLTVGGTQITGILTCNADWFEAQPLVKALADQIREGNAERRAVEAAVDSVENADPRWLKAITSESKIGYVHLRDARVLVGTSLVPTASGTFWRGKIADVSGWWLGTLHAGEASTS